jgi:hypothetical protein
MLLETERWEVHASSEHFGLGQNTDTSDTIKFHLHIGIAIRVSKVGEMRSPGSVLGISLNNDGILVQGVCKSKGGLGFLP